MITIHLNNVTGRRVAIFAIALAALTETHIRAQGTLLFTFEGTPSGVRTQFGANPYSGPTDMKFGPGGPQSLYLSGGGISGYADNGTGYLELPGGSLTFGYNPSTMYFPLVPFDLVSFDAAEYSSFPFLTITVVGYHPMAGTVTNTFSMDGIQDGPGGSPDFQTFYLDSGFQNVFKVQMFGSLALDNVVISGVPEPSALQLLVVGAAFALYARGRFVPRRV